MAGTNKVLNEGQVLFLAGDESDGMYLIRRGELQVYLEQDGKEVTLAKIGPGNMIGEMALFEEKPRSASVKASSETEVTHISKQDFSRLMKQIPKWFVALMSALSSRLRQTNDRLQKLENTGGGGAPFQRLQRLINVTVLLWHKDGWKEGKDWFLPKKATEETLTQIFGEDTDKVHDFFKTLIDEHVVTIKRDSYKNEVFASQNRGRLSQLSEFIREYAQNNPDQPCLPDPAVNLLTALTKATEESPYDTISLSLDDLIKAGKRQGIDTSGWKEVLGVFKTAGEAVNLIKTSSGVGLRASKKTIAPFAQNHRLLAAFYKRNLV